MVVISFEIKKLIMDQIAKNDREYLKFIKSWQNIKPSPDKDKL